MEHPELKIPTEDGKMLRLFELPSGALVLGVFLINEGETREVTSLMIPMDKRDLISEFVRL